MGCVSLVNSHARGLPSYDAMGRPLPRGSMPRIIDGHPPANAARFCVSQIVGLQGCLAACPARAPPPPSPPPQGSPAHQCLESLAIQPDLAKDGRIVDMGGHGTVARSLATGRRPAAAARQRDPENMYETPVSALQRLLGSHEAPSRDLRRDESIPAAQGVMAAARRRTSIPKTINSLLLHPPPLLGEEAAAALQRHDYCPREVVTTKRKSLGEAVGRCSRHRKRRRRP